MCNCSLDLLYFVFNFSDFYFVIIVKSKLEDHLSAHTSVEALGNSIAKLKINKKTVNLLLKGRNSMQHQFLFLV
jgi:hypothetical protein